MGLDRSAALRREHAEIVRFCRELSDEEWHTPSAAPGWRVLDVVAHLGGSARAIFTPTSLKLLASDDIERTNDELVARRRDWQPARVLAEFEQWGRRLSTLAAGLSRTPLAVLRLPLGELGRFPAAVLLNSAFVFDQHTHLRYDIAPALGRPAPESDELRVSVVLEWMFAVLAEFEQWGRRLSTLAAGLSRTPLAALRLPLGELGRFPAALLLNSAFVFDQHTHLRYDIAPALGRPAPESDELRVSVVLEWMFAVLANQLRAARPAWLDRPIAISLSGPGGGRWRVGVDGGIAADPVGAGDTAAHIAGAAQDFPGWATTRTPWREQDVRIEGDAALAGALLDSMNVV